MSARKTVFSRLALVFAALATTMLTSALRADPITLTVNVDKPGAKIDPIFYGLMTEEINYSYDGGLYAELIRNRIFQDVPPRAGGRRGGPETTQPAIQGSPNLVNWSAVTSDGATGEIDIDTNNPVNAAALKNSLRLDIKSVAAGKRVGAANTGYWGIPVKPNTEYTVSFYARASNGFNAPVTAAIEGMDNNTVYASGQVPAVDSNWRKYTLKIKTGQVQPTTAARFVLSAAKPGSVWFSLVSLFPPTYKNRPNGNRVDIMELLAGMKPSFLRFPGGNYLEGPNFENRFNWKATIGPLEERAGHMSPWNYRSTDGMGLYEFLMWCDDLNMEPIVGIYAGLHIDRGANILTGDALKPHVQDALDEIEYITGDVSTKWGAERAKAGHPKPFTLRYVEIGNEDWLNGGTNSYSSRFEMFYDAIKAKYPEMHIMSTMRSRDRDFVHSRKPDLLDDHFYVTIPTALSQAHLYDKYDRNGSKIFVGEWATNSPGFNPRGGPTGHMAFALGDAAWLTGLERNADVITMNCYAPLFCNINPGGMQWAINLMGHDALGSFGSPAYYVQKMYSSNRGDVVLPAKFDPLPTLNAEQIPQAPAPQGRGAAAAAGGGRGGPAGPFDAVYVNATRETSSGDVILKLVNVQAAPQSVKIDLQGVGTINPKATGEVLSGDLDGMNSVAEPTKVAPNPITITNAGAKFDHQLPAHSVSVIRVKTK